MANVSGEIDIGRGPAEVFSYVADPRRRPEWQDAVEKIEVETTANDGVGTRVRETRRVQNTSRTFTWEVTEYAPGRTWAFRGIEGPVRAVVSMSFAALQDGSSTRVHIDIDFEGRGIGRLFAIFARQGARKEIPQDLQHLKRHLEQDRH